LKYIIYITTNTVNRAVYIGKHQTLDINDNYLGSGKLLVRAVEKYGRENFVKEVLHVFDNEVEMNDKEAELVTALAKKHKCSRQTIQNTFFYVYNEYPIDYEINRRPSYQLFREKQLEKEAQKNIREEIKREKTLKEIYSKLNNKEQKFLSKYLYNHVGPTGSDSWTI